MQVFRFLPGCTALLVAGCSLAFDGSRFTGESAAVDGGDGIDTGVADASIELDGGGRDAGSSDGGANRDGNVRPTCTGVGTCGAGQYCNDGSCKPCDEDGDGFRVGVPECQRAGEPIDCNDSNPRVYPSAVPTCGNGVDESCGLMAPGLPVTELGFLAVQEVSIPSGSEVGRLRVFARNNDQALVFAQLNDGRRTPIFAEVPLAASAVSPVPNESISTRVHPDVGHGELAYDAVRSSDDAIHFALFMTNGGKVSSRLTTFPKVGGFSNLGGQEYPETLTWGMQVAGEPALVQDGAQFVLGVPMRVPEGTVSTPRIVAFGLSNSEVVVSGGVADDSLTNRWSVSDGRTAVFPGAGNSLLLWRGGRGFDHVNTVFSPEPTLGRVGVGTRDIGGIPRHSVIIPSASLVRVMSASCPWASPFGMCAFDGLGASSFAPSYGPGGDPLLTSFMSDEGGFNFVHATRGAGDPVDGLAFGHYMLTAGRSELMPLPTDGMTGMIRDLDIDGYLERQPSAPSEERGTATLAYGWVRSGPSGTRLFVGGIRACVGYATR